MARQKACLTNFPTLLKFSQIYLPQRKARRIFPSGGRDAKEFPEGAYREAREDFHILLEFP
jgi:hypothetical protein